MNKDAIMQALCELADTSSYYACLYDCLLSRRPDTDAYLDELVDQDFNDIQELKNYINPNNI